ncbi:MAG: hypothetical protein WBM71_04885 [Sedimenticolaceae bacterium]
MHKTLIVLALVSAPAFAQQPTPQPMPDLDKMFFEQFDTDGDGKVTKGEFMKPTEAQFDHMDQDGNGELDQAEVKAFNDGIKQRMQEMQRQIQMQMQQAPQN